MICAPPSEIAFVNMLTGCCSTNVSIKAMLRLRVSVFEQLQRNCLMRGSGAEALNEALAVEKNPHAKLSSLEVRSSVAASHRPPLSDMIMTQNSDRCEVCRKGGVLAACEGPCRRSYHRPCLRSVPNAPPVLPGEDWYCRDCRRAKEVGNDHCCAAVLCAYCWMC